MRAGGARRTEPRSRPRARDDLTRSSAAPRSPRSARSTHGSGHATSAPVDGQARAARAPRRPAHPLGRQRSRPTSCSEDADRLGGTPIARARRPRSEATVCGTVRSVTLRPRVNVPALVVELYDGSQTPQPRLAGTPQIGGIEPGTYLTRQRPGDLQARHPDDLQPGLRHQASPWPLRSAPPRATPLADARTVETVEELIRARLSAALGGCRGLGSRRRCRRWPSSSAVGLAPRRADRRRRVRGRRARARWCPGWSQRQTPALRRSPPSSRPRSRRSSRCAAAGPRTRSCPASSAAPAAAPLALVSVVARWPAGRLPGRRRRPAHGRRPARVARDRGLVRVCQRLTLVLVGLYVLRVAVMLPLYLAGEVAAARRRQDRPGLAGSTSAAVAVMGLMLCAAARPRRADPRADTARLRRQRRTPIACRAPIAGRRVRPGREAAVGRREHRLEVVLDVGRRDEQQLVVRPRASRRGWARSGGPRG